MPEQRLTNPFTAWIDAVGQRGVTFACRGGRCEALPGGALCGPLFALDGRRLAGVPLLMNAPCSHCEQISTRGSDAAVAPTWPQCGQVIWVSMSVATASDGAAPQVFDRSHR